VIANTGNAMQFLLPVLSCLGAIPQVMANGSGVLIVFGGLPGAGETIEVMTTAPAQLATSLLMMPFA